VKVLAAMSGGVDSAVAAARAVDAGHDVVGVHLALSRMPGTLRTGSRGCCTIEDSMDAQRAANIIGIPYYVWDFSERFKLDVVDDFIAEYSAGRTPNPCMRCNERIKFAALLEKALALGFDAVATGHYATILTDGDGNRELHRASAWAKDQSYVLGVLTADQLAHSMFPLGATPSKAEVRAEAAARGFSVASKPDSHDICFIPDGDTRGWLADRVGAQPGDILDQAGTVMGKHDGALAFTIGQRKEHGRRRTARGARPRRDCGLEDQLGGDAAGRSGRAVRLRRPDSRTRRSRSRRGIRARRRAGHPSGQSTERGLGRPVRGDLRRHAGPRPVHHRPHGLCRRLVGRRLRGRRRILTSIHTFSHTFFRNFCGGCCWRDF
jgi:tRNA (5-methylaminomethyl-2-thiouridylate)-methyltransferase